MVGNVHCLVAMQSSPLLSLHFQICSEVLGKGIQALQGFTLKAKGK